MNREDLIDVALGKVNADLVIKGGNLVNVCTREIYPADIAVKGERIAVVGNVDHVMGPKTKVLNAKGKYIAPGLIDTHIHTYETQLGVDAFVRAAMPHGTTAIPTSFYGEGIIGGTKAIRFLLDEFEKTPLKILFLVPLILRTCFAGNSLDLPPIPSGVKPEELLEMLDWPGCIGLEESEVTVVLKKDPVIAELISKALKRGKVITGHAAGFRGKELCAYLTTGSSSDHECGSMEEAIEKARLGMWILVREGSACADLAQVIKAITEGGIDPHRFAFSVDLISAVQLDHDGYLDQCIRLAIKAGVDQIVAVQMATINAAEYLKVADDHGSVAPGKFADILLVDDLPSFKVSTVIASGEVVAQDGKFIAPIEPIEYPEWMYNAVKFKRPIEPGDFEIKAPEGKKQVEVRVMGVNEGTLISDRESSTLTVDGGLVQPDIEQDILKISMVESHGLTGNVGNGFVRGFGLKSGAIATTYVPVHMNVTIIGTNDLDMSFAANKLAEVGGGHIVVKNREVLALYECPLLGLESDSPLYEALEKYDRLYEAVRELGGKLTNPFHQLAFSGAIIPDLGTYKIFDNGLWDCPEQKTIDIFIT
jgi:adenine deaminase